jgi:hypothetical protein
MSARPSAPGATAILDRWAKPVWFGMTLTGALIVVAVVALTSVHGHDALAYWLVDSAEPYAIRGAGLTGFGAFRYSPTAALVMDPLGLIPWPVFVTAWLAVQVAALRYLGGAWVLALAVLPPVWLDLVAGNVNVVLAAVVVAGFRWPGLWAFAALTKVTPVVGIAWFVGRHDWRGLAWALGTTMALVAVTVAVLGIDAWRDWVAVLAGSTWQTPNGISLPIALLPRVLAATALALYAGARNRPWLVPIAVVLAMPTLWVIAFAPLIAIVGVVRRPIGQPQPVVSARLRGLLAQVPWRPIPGLTRPASAMQAIPVVATAPTTPIARASGIVQPSGGTAVTRFSANATANSAHVASTPGRPAASSRNTNVG